MKLGYPESTIWLVQTHCNGRPQSEGSAVAVILREINQPSTARVYLLTAQHVVRDNNGRGKPCNDIRVWAPGRAKTNQFKINAKICSSITALEDRELTDTEMELVGTDWVLLELDEAVSDSVTHFVTTWPTAEATVGTDCRLFGYTGEGGLADTGMVRPTNPPAVFQVRNAILGSVGFDASISRDGMSGGAVFSTENEFIGVHRDRTDPTLRMHAVSAFHIRQRLRAAGFEPAIQDAAQAHISSRDSRGEDLAQYCNEVHAKWNHRETVYVRHRLENYFEPELTLGESKPVGFRKVVQKARFLCVSDEPDTGKTVLGLAAEDFLCGFQAGSEAASQSVAFRIDDEWSSEYRTSIPSKFDLDLDLTDLPPQRVSMILDGLSLSDLHRFAACFQSDEWLRGCRVLLLCRNSGLSELYHSLILPYQWQQASMSRWSRSRVHQYLRKYTDQLTVRKLQHAAGEELSKPGIVRLISDELESGNVVTDSISSSTEMYSQVCNAQLERRLIQVGESPSKRDPLKRVFSMIAFAIVRYPELRQQGLSDLRNVLREYFRSEEITDTDWQLARRVCGTFIARSSDADGASPTYSVLGTKKWVEWYAGLYLAKYCSEGSAEELEALLPEWSDIWANAIQMPTRDRFTPVLLQSVEVLWRQKRSDQVCRLINLAFEELETLREFQDVALHLCHQFWAAFENEWNDDQKAIALSLLPADVKLEPRRYGVQSEVAELITELGISEHESDAYVRFPSDGVAIKFRSRLAVDLSDTSGTETKIAPVYMQRDLVSQSQVNLFLGDAGDGAEQMSDDSAEGLTWHQAMVFARSVAPCARLPSSVEWEAVRESAVSVAELTGTWNLCFDKAASVSKDTTPQFANYRVICGGPQKAYQRPMAYLNPSHRMENTGFRLCFEIPPS